MNRCPVCSEPIEPSYKFCPNCGSKISGEIIEKPRNMNNIIRCDVCGEETPAGSGYCESCGARLSGKEKVLSISKTENSVVNTESRQRKQQSDAVKKNVPKIKKTVTEEKLVSNKLNNTQILLLLAALVIIGFIILEVAGVFDKGTEESVQTQAGNNEQQQQPVVDLAALEQINTLESTVKKDSSNAGNILELAHRLNDANLFERAVEYYKMYLRKVPKNADVLVDLGVCYFEMKQYDIAKYYMNKGLAINPQHQIAQFNLGIVNLSAGNVDSAKYWWNKAVAVNPATDIGKKAKELLESH